MLSPVRGFTVFKLMKATRVYNKLAFVTPSDQAGHFDVYYDDSEFKNVPTRMMPIGLAASGPNLSKPWVYATAAKEMPNLREKLVEDIGLPLEPVRLSAIAPQQSATPGICDARHLLILSSLYACTELPLARGQP